MQKIVVGAIFAVAILMSGCATYKTFDDVPADQLNDSTLRSGDKLQLEYDDGSIVKLTVDTLTENAIVSTDGEHWPKKGVKKLTIKIPANSADCGSLASWQNGRCWKEDAKRALGEALY